MNTELINLLLLCRNKLASVISRIAVKEPLIEADALLERAIQLARQQQEDKA